MKDSPATQLGKDMWRLLAGTFQDTLAANNLTTLPEKAQLWAGFIAAAAGHMTGDIGGPNTHAILFTIAEACAVIGDEHQPAKQRPDLKVVKP